MSLKPVTQVENLPVAQLKVFSILGAFQWAEYFPGWWSQLSREEEHAEPGQYSIEVLAYLKNNK